MAERDVLACVPTASQGAIAEGSTRDRCADCRRGVWVAPSGRELVAEHNLTILCVPCAIESATREGVPFEDPQPSQLAEIIQHYAHRRRN